MLTDLLVLMLLESMTARQLDQEFMRLYFILRPSEATTVH